jgi:glucose uptake protein GlcU
MKIRNTSIWDISTRIPEIYGTLIAISLIAYFFLMYAVGLIHVIELRLVNLVFLLAGVYLALRQYRRTHRGHMDYFHAFTTGMATAAIGTLTFSVFLLIYLHIDKSLMQAISEQPLGMYLDPYIASLMVSLEGIFSGLFVTFLLSNYLAARTPVPRAPREHSELIQ